MTSCQQYATICFLLADDVRCRRGGQDTVLPYDELRYPVSRTYLEDSLDRFVREVAAIPPDDEGRSLGIDGIEYRLDEILCVVLGKRSEL